MIRAPGGAAAPCRGRCAVPPRSSVTPAVACTAPGARSVPITALHAELDRLPADQDVVAYCRGPYCVYADDAVRELHRRGLPARRLEDGYPEWVDAGLPTTPG
jgi:rhodanese-related sulfurtransferase